METKRRISLRREVYLILSGVLLLALAVQVTHSEYVLQFSENEQLDERMLGRKFVSVEPSQLASSGYPICLAFDSSDDASNKTNSQAQQVLQYMKKPVKSFDLAYDSLEPAGCEAVIASTTMLGNIGNPDRLSDYVEKGGYVFLTQVSEMDDSFYRLYRKMGIVNTGDRVGEARGIRLTSSVLIGEKGLEINEDFIINSTNIVELEQNARVLAMTASGIPLLWDHPFGKGKFMVFNGTMLQGSMNRGLLAGGLSLLLPDFIYPVFNSKVMYIDDFPAPIPKGKNEAIYRDYKRSIPAFFQYVWWPQMIKSAKKHDIRYTAVLIQSYNDRVVPPFGAPVDEDKAGLLSYGREVIKSGGEIGLHGYNHQSLQLNPELAAQYGYKAWPGVEEMTESVREALRFFKTAFPNYGIVTYVPPSNVLSPEGREALKKAWPGLSIIASLYGDRNDTEAYVQEYAIASDGILEMPRVTFGYMDKPFNRWAEANAMTSLGLYSHFLHPDDLLDPERSLNLSWEVLHREYDNMLSRIDDTYPWLRPMTATEAALDMASVLTSKVDVEREGNLIKGTILPFAGDAYFLLRTEKRFGALKGCEVRKLDETTYLIHANKADFQLELSD